jgi:carbamoyl-phosphate synthase large subunit
MNPHVRNSEYPMPGDTIFIIGAGPIVIGQACEFDYSGCQACKVLKQQRFRTILLNSNPATIMTDPEMADAVYIEPMTVETCEAIIKREKPKYLLPTMGGQTALNLASSLGQQGILKKYNVTLLGVQLDSIQKAESRDQFKKLVESLGYFTLPSQYVRSIKEATSILGTVPFPLIIRPSFTLGGQGGVVVHTEDEYLTHIKHSLELSPIGEVLVEKSCVGWKEIELEVMKDGFGNCVIVCGIENMDPMGVHTGDSITVAPLQTVTDEEYQVMRNQTIHIMEALGVRTGGANIQFCQDPKTKKFYVIEVNPRVSRSSALASKATGFPIAKIATLVALGMRLDEIMNDITHKTPVSFEPALDYVVVKIPKFNFEKFTSEPPELGISMKAIGETMAIGRSFEESLMKALRSLSQSDDPIFDFNQKYAHQFKSLEGEALRHLLSTPHPNRIYYIWHAFQKGFTVEEVNDLTRISSWFLGKIYNLVNLELALETASKIKLAQFVTEAYSHGFSTNHIMRLNHKAPTDLSKLTYSVVDTCAAEFESFTPYIYSTQSASNDTVRNHLKKDEWIGVIGSGPNQIGQGLEFDYTCVHAAQAIQAMGKKVLLFNNNPETVSTDYDTGDALFFEPIAPFELKNTFSNFKNLKGAIVMMGGQSAIQSAPHILSTGKPIIGTSLEAINICEDRDLFRAFLKKCKLKTPKGALIKSQKDFQSIEKFLKFPIITRPSYIIGGSFIHVFRDPQELESFQLNLNKLPTPPYPILAEEFLVKAKEFDCDIIRDKSGNIVIAGIMEHVEDAGVHSGDSTAIFPPFMAEPSDIAIMESAAKRIVTQLNVVGLINIQFAIKDAELFIIEVNPRASRTIPILSKITGFPIAKIATQVIFGDSLERHFPLINQFYSMNSAHIPFYGIKKPVFPFDRFKGADVILGPQMKSTGEVMGIAQNFYEAYEKALIASGNPIPKPGSTFFISLCDEDKPYLQKIVEPLIQNNYKIVTTEGTQRKLSELGIESQKVFKRSEGHPNVVDLVAQGRIQFIFNTTKSKHSTIDEKHIRRVAISFRAAYSTTLSEMLVIANLIKSSKIRKRDVHHLKEFHQNVNLRGVSHDETLHDPIWETDIRK